MANRRSLFSLVTYCALSVLITALALMVFFASATAILALAYTGKPEVETMAASTQPSATDETSKAVDSTNAIIFEGVVTDDHCGPRHDMGSAKSPSECAQMCVLHGAHYAIINGDKEYALTGREDLALLAGERATVAGTLTGNTIKIMTISRTEEPR